MQKVIVALTVLAFAAIGVAACSGGAGTPGTTATPTGMPVVRASSKIVAEGKVVPARSAALGFQVSGVVAEVPVAVGDRVDSGKVLARLDARQLELQLVQAEANLTSAQAAYDRLLHPDPNDLTALRADVDKAKAVLDQAQAAYDRIGGDSNPFAGMSSQRAQLQTAWLDHQKAQALYNAKVMPQDLLVQQTKASLDAARAARDLAAEQVTRARIAAPFAGTVASIEIKPGEQAAAGVPVLRLADLSNLQVETTDLTEINVVNVKEGDTATLTFDAIPDLELTGKVVSIEGYGENRQGDIVYTLVIKPDKQDERLRWNMTATVSIAR